MSVTSARSEESAAASLTTKKILTAMKNLAGHSKQGAVSLNDLVWHFVNAGSKGRRRAELAPTPEDQKAFRARIVELLRQGASDGACHMVKPNTYRLGADQRNKGAVAADCEKNFRSDNVPSKIGDLEAILEAHLNDQIPKKKVKIGKQLKSPVTKDESQTVYSIASIASIKSLDAKNNTRVAKQKFERRKNEKSPQKDEESLEHQENKMNEPKRTKSRKIAARESTKNLSKVKEEDDHQDSRNSLGSSASHDKSQTEKNKPDVRKVRPRKTPIIRKARNVNKGQSDPDVAMTARRPRAVRAKTAPVKRTQRRTTLNKIDVETETRLPLVKRLPKASVPIEVPDLDVENLTRAQSFELLSKIFAREARREGQRLNRHSKKMTVATAPLPPAPVGEEGRATVQVPLTVEQPSAESGDCPEKMIICENSQLNAGNREEGTAV